MNLRLATMLCGFLLLLIIVANLTLYYISNGNLSVVFWYCDIAAIILIYAIYTKNNFLATSVLVTAIPAQFYWIVDFILEIFGYGAGRTALLFENVNGIRIILPVLLHTLLIPTAFFTVKLYGFNKRSIIFSIGFFSITLLVATYMIFSPSVNINCVFYPCDLSYYKNFIEIVNTQSYANIIYLLKYIIVAILLATISHTLLSIVLKR